MKRVNINLPENLFTVVQNYCDLNSFTFTELVRNLLRQEVELVNRKDLKKVEKFMNIDPDPSSGMGQELKTLVDKVVKQENVLYPSIKKTEKTLTKVKKAETCPHMISVGGNCKPCGGLAE